jgi:hypothetical protein
MHVFINIRSASGSAARPTFVGLAILSLGFVFACSNDVDPRVISGGGVGDGAIDGRLNVYVIDTKLCHLERHGTARAVS